MGGSDVGSGLLGGSVLTVVFGLSGLRLHAENA